MCLSGNRDTVCGSSESGDAQSISLICAVVFVDWLLWAEFRCIETAESRCAESINWIWAGVSGLVVVQGIRLIQQGSERCSVLTIREKRDAVC